MKTHILIVEDEEYIAEVLIAYCQNSGFEVTHLASGAEVVATVKSQTFDLMLLDLMLPDMDGIEICKQVRQFSQLPIIMVTAKSEEIDRLIGLELGADDYICKPFSPREVIARVKTVLRRTLAIQANPAIHSPELVLGQFVLKPDEYEARFSGCFLDLTPKEFMLLRLLVEHPGRVYSRDDILNALYSDLADVSDRNIDTHIKNIRKKIHAVAPTANPIRSIYGVGYKLLQETLK
ncbi:response regulator [Shewanella livingstonensis]|uniref:Response regulator n=1 Tax=Shewanella livingstonensis TaxID=150120 RepID=A0A3G8LZD8_9GAMM|nr:response regulator [Shewanella livingstonensis]AZG75016.1 response regulator [Shewanella livingstonensis]